MKDHKGAAYAMEMAQQVWRKKPVSGSTTIAAPVVAPKRPRTDGLPLEAAVATRSSAKKPKTASIRRPPAAFQPPTPSQSPLLSLGGFAAARGSGSPLIGFAYTPMYGRTATDSAAKKSLDGFNPLGFTEAYYDKPILSSPQLKDHLATATGRRLSSAATTGVDNDDQTMLDGFFGVGILTHRTTVLKIFALLSDQDRRNARLVCKDWASLLQIEQTSVPV
jgi:hypothetical protein